MVRKRTAGARSSVRGRQTKPRKKGKANPNDVVLLRSLAHDLSNALEAILQAAYLLGQSTLDESPRRWAQLIDSSSQEAARLNREIRKLLRALSEE